MTRPEPTLRERKRRRTREAIVAAAQELFETHGYEATTVADIADAAEIGARTFFTYFASKDEVLLPEVDARIDAVRQAIATRGAHDGPVEVLSRALAAVVAGGQDLVGPRAELRMRLIGSQPGMRGRAAALQVDAEREIAGLLQREFPDRLDPVAAGALVGAFVGSVTGALRAVLDTADPGDIGTTASAITDAVDVALRPWRDNA